MEQENKMKKIILIVLILVLASIISSCVPAYISEAKTTTTPEIIINGYEIMEMNSGVSRFIDKEAGVVCWMSRVSYGYSISCLPLDATLLEH